MNRVGTANANRWRPGHLLWPAVAAAFLLGYYLGQTGHAPVRPAAAPDAEPVAADRPAPPPAAEPESTAAGTAATDDVLRGGAWYATLDRLEDVSRRGDAVEAEAVRERLLEAVRQVAREGDARGALTLAQAYRDRNPHDPEGYLLAAELQHTLGRFEDAVSVLLDLLVFADEPEVVSRARDSLRALVDDREAHLANTGDVDTLIRLFEDLSRRDPGYDRHRLRLAHWQLRAGRAAAAQRTLAETGTVGVDPRAREDLAAAARLARTGLPLTRHGSSLQVQARLGGRPLTLLVDTGATTTAITRSRAAALGAVPTGQFVQVRTANGVVESEVHQVSDLSIGELHLDTLAVLVLEGPLPRDVDGLLGMDVLSRFDAVPVER